MNHLKFAKLCEINGMIIGSVGSASEYSLLNIFAKTNLPDGNDEKDILNYFFKFSSWKRENGAGASLDNDYVFGYNEKAFYVEGSGLLVREITDYHSIGSGADYSLAALYLGCHVTDAVNVACKLNCYVGEPIIYYEMKIKGETSNEINVEKC